MAEGTTQAIDWEALGAAEAARLAEVHALVVTGRDVHAAARVALGFGRAASAGRRVAIADLAGEIPELQSLVKGDDPHGIVDSFHYGVSLNRIARQIDDRGMLFVMPTGSEPEVDAEILRNDRWYRLASGFREVGALLMLVVPAGVEGAAELLTMVDGALVVGDASTLGIPADRTLGVVPAPYAAGEGTGARPRIVTPAMVASITPPEFTPVGTDALPPAGESAASGLRTPSLSKQVAVIDPPPSRRPYFIAAAVLVAAVGIWFLVGRPQMERRAAAQRAAADSVARLDSARVAQARAAAADSSTAVTTGPAGPASDSAIIARVDSLRMLLPANPQDSARAVAFGVVVLATNDPAQALARWTEQRQQGIPAGTITQVQLAGQRGVWYQVMAGAYGRAPQADSLLVSMRDSTVIGQEMGRVAALPFALALESKVGRRAAKAVADGYVQREVAAYPLLQPDGTATIYVGAFASPEQAAPQIAALRARGISPTLVYRTGRSF
ncbi:MAG: SPOR domain-containing protein [Gemmatimonadaceae bacterium]|jgi:hypothetical protein|nr:SPOR domain-containing protein [Gemmatimonadaceae bacterium]MCU0627118.1 SPOR domain-containing protein [Gemmatimonadaceae bacterium]